LAFGSKDAERRRLLSRPKNRVALALGAGGARGYAHIGAIAEIEARGYEIVGIAGTSMGAMIGGLFAANALDEYTDWVSGLNKRDVASLLDLSISAPGTMKAEKVMAKVSSLLGGVRIEDLRIPFTALAADLMAQKEIWFQDGPLDLALRASISIPGVFTPIVINGQLLADGGLFNPLPLSPLAAIPADLVMAISLSGPRKNGHVGSPLTTAKKPLSATTKNLVSSEISQAIKQVPSGLRTIDVLELSVQSMQSLLQRYQVSTYPPDVQVDVPVDSCGVLEFYRASELIEIGRTLTARALDNLAQAS
jgi:NTE family protein